MEKRGHEFFDDTMRIGRVMDLLNRSRVQQGFEQQVVGDAPQQIERKVGELVDWLVDADLRQWQDVTEAPGRTAPSVSRSDRRRLRLRHAFTAIAAGCIESVNRESQKVIDSFDRRKEARELADDARNAVAAAAAVSAGGVGLGAIVTIAATTAAADVTGIIMASVIAALGFFILPAKREQAKEADAAQDSATCVQRLSDALHEQFAKEIRQERRSHSREHRAVQPLRQSRRGKARNDRAGASRDRRRAGVAARPDREAGRVAELPPIVRWRGESRCA